MNETEKEEFYRSALQFTDEMADLEIYRVEQDLSAYSPEFAALKLVAENKRRAAVKEALGEEGASQYYKFVDLLQRSEGLFGLLASTPAPLRWDQAVALSPMIESLGVRMVNRVLSVPSAEQYSRAITLAEQHLTSEQMPSFETWLAMRIARHQFEVDRNIKR